MEGIVGLILLLLAAWLLLPIILLIRTASLNRRTAELERRMAAVERDRLRFDRTPAPAPPRPEPVREAGPPVPAEATPLAPTHVPPRSEVPRQPSPPVSPPAQPRMAPSAPSPAPQGVGQRYKVASPIDWEQFLGVKLFAWIGGLVLFLGVAFFVKYSFEHNLISPQMRLVAAYLLGVGLLAGGLAIPRDRQAVTAQTLCAAGVLILYANVFASNAYYHFTGIPVTFALMALVTVVAFLLAVRLEAQVVAVLGLLGG